MTDKDLTRAEVVAFMKMRDMQPSHYKMGRQLLRCMDDSDGWQRNAWTAREKWSKFETLAEAAEQRVATLEAENAQLREELNKAVSEFIKAREVNKRLTALLRSHRDREAENTRLREALKPFADCARDREAADLEAEGPDRFDRLVRDGIEEAIRAMRKFPQPNYVISKIAEEAGEVVKAAIHAAEGRETAENLRGEMKQLIAMLYRLWIEGDQVHGLGSVSAALTPPDDLVARVEEARK